MFFVVKERNTLAETIAITGLSTADFGVMNDDSYALNHRPTGFWFMVFANPNAGAIVGPFNVKTEPDRIVSSFDANGITWNELLIIFQKWLFIVKEEMEIPDLWSSAQSAAAFLTPDDNLADEAFSENEILILAEKVKAIESSIKKLALPPAAESAIVDVVRDVPNEAKFFTKKKLAEVVVGQLISQGMKWGLTLDHMQAIWHAFQGFRQLLVG
jgi:hypothetical protein